MDKRVIVFGEILFDCFDDKAVIGGASYNFCHWFANLGGEVWLCSAVGNDTLGQLALEKMTASRVRPDLMSVVNNETGKCVVTCDENGKPQYQLKEDVAYDYIQADVEKVRQIEASVFCFGTIAQRTDHNAHQLENVLSHCKFDEVFCDVNVREGAFSDGALKLCLENATILKYSDDEEKYVKSIVGDNVLDSITQKYKKVKLIVRTMGERGAQVFDVKKNMVHTFDAKKVDVKSTVGCGDSYCAAFLYHYLRGDSIEKCAKKARDLSAYVATLQGAVE